MVPSRQEEHAVAMEVVRQVEENYHAHRTDTLYTKLDEDTF
jgi:hypothetical protein